VALLACLAEQIDQFVPYRDLKREVLARTGGGGGAEEATFCQKLKSRIKVEFVPGIDRLIVTSNKGDGYRLRAEGEAKAVEKLLMWRRTRSSRFCSRGCRRSIPARLRWC